MDVGTVVIFQGGYGLRSDFDVYQDDLKLADLAEPLGFDSLWSVEHHFTDYAMCPDVLQMLSYWAGRTQKIKLGSLVTVLPWHLRPVRVAEQICALDNLSGGRAMLGIGRGLGRIEFEGLDVPMDESRERFVEAAQLILEGLEKGYCEFEGRFFRQPRRELRPAPLRSFRDRTFAAAVSPESSQIMARLGVALAIIPQKSWKDVAVELDAYRATYREVNGAEAPPPMVAAWVFCDPDPDRARELARRYIANYYGTVLRHYELRGEHLKTTKGYEFYSAQAEAAKALSDDQMAENFVNLHVWGTPEQCYEKVMAIRARTGAESFAGVFSYGGMPHEESVRNMQLFAQAVMPELRKVPREAAVRQVERA
jgi:alkanesulfonate monooxygenase SsuD/methylene tetrahydromethanopterin reductase-like flavin-dependent oxidoreductase (luciferase family)